jgi:CxxC motif-containing protein (DUF1111 family)
MPHTGVHLTAFRLPHGPFLPAPPGGRVVWWALISAGALAIVLATAPAFVGAQTLSWTGVHDPGVRRGPASAGGPISGATPDELAVFAASKAVFNNIDSVSGAPIDGAAGNGLGPRFNLDSCSGCHAQPNVGGSSPLTNPQTVVQHRGGATNPEDLSAFIKPNGPVREVRFKTNPDGSPDGGVHDLFTITGRSDGGGCNITQPDFGAALANHNAIFRIPTPVFGAGLIEAIPDQTILDNKNASASLKAGLGIAGRPNREGNTGTIARFGWKAQNKSLALFAGEAYNVEMGVTNEIFPDEREQAAGCQLNSTPEDHTNFTLSGGVLTSTPSDVVNFSLFMRLLDPPARQQIDQSTAAGAALALSVQNGEQKFGAVGCALCHTPSLETGKASSLDPNVGSSTALTDRNANLFSDLLIHDMGIGLADGISQGDADGNEFRTAPLWGLGQRIFFLHDGRTTSLLQAIQAHASTGSEANGVIANFYRLSDVDKQSVLNFLRSL